MPSHSDYNQESNEEKSSSISSPPTNRLKTNMSINKSGVKLSVISNTKVSSDNDTGTDSTHPCQCCQSNPCYFELYKENIFAALNNQYICYDGENGKDFTYNNLNGQKLTNATLRKSLYKYYVYYWHGHLGKGNRVRVEECVTSAIRKMFPEKNNNYLGFQIN